MAIEQELFLWESKHQGSKSQRNDGAKEIAFANLVETQLIDRTKGLVMAFIKRAKLGSLAFVAIGAQFFAPLRHCAFAFTGRKKPEIPSFVALPTRQLYALLEGH